jgi:hypothetical protein
MSDVEYIDCQTAIDAVNAQAFEVKNPEMSDYGRRIVHCYSGGFGCDWDAEGVIQEIKKADQIAWVDNWMGHDLVTVSAEGQRAFGVRRPSRELTTLREKIAAAICKEMHHTIHWPGTCNGGIFADAVLGVLREADDALRLSMRVEHEVARHIAQTVPEPCTDPLCCSGGTHDVTFCVVDGEILDEVGVCSTVHILTGQGK